MSEHSWTPYIRSVSVALPFPVAVGIEHDENGRERVFVELTVRCHDAGETITVKTRQHVQPLGILTETEAAKVIRDLVRIAMCHEIDEAISIDGARPFHPHKPKEPK